MLITKVIMFILFLCKANEPVDQLIHTGTKGSTPIYPVLQSQLVIDGLIDNLS